jgi:hypothetical protein
MQRSSGREWGGGVAILSATPEPRALRAALGRAVSRWPRLRESSPPRSFAIGPAAIGSRFDLDYHLRWETLDCDDELIAVTAQRFFQPLDEARPPWELHVLSGPERSLLLVKMARRLAPETDPAPLLSALVSGAESRPSAPPSASPGNGVAPGSAEVEAGEAGDVLSGVLRVLESAQSAMRESVAMLRTATSRTPPSAEDVKALAWRAASALATRIASPIANPLPSALIETVSGTLRLALVDLPSAALDAARAPFGLELDDVLVSIGAATMARLEGRSAGRRKLRALVAAPQRSGVVLSGQANDPLEGAREVHRLLARSPARPNARALPAWRGDVAAALAGAPAARRRPYDLSVCYDRSPLAGRRLAGAEVVRVYPIDSTPRSARLAIGAQRCRDRLSLGLTFSTAMAREPAEVLEAFRSASAEFIDAARTTRPPAPPA